MQHQEFITLLCKNKLNKKQKELITDFICDKEKIDDFYNSDYYQNLRKYTNTPSVFSQVAIFSFSLSSIVASKEKIDFYEIRDALIRNKEINSLAKLRKFIPVNNNDIKSLFQKHSSLPGSFIYYIAKENTTLALDIFKHYQNIFSGDEFKEIDKSIKSKISELLFYFDGKPNLQALKIINNYPFYKTEGHYDEKSTWQILTEFWHSKDKMDNSKLGKFKELCEGIKIKENSVSSFLFYIIFENPLLKIEELPEILNTHIEKNLKVNNILQPVLENKNISFKDFSFQNKFITFTLPHLLNHFHIDSFYNLNFRDSAENPKNIVIFDNLLSNSLTPSISLEDKIEYLKMILSPYSMNNIIKSSYQPDKALLVLKSTMDVKEKEILYETININHIYNQHNYIVKSKKPDSNLKKSQDLIIYLMEKELYPNIGLQHIYHDFNIEIISEIEDEYIKEMLYAQKDNKMFFLPFIKQSLDTSGEVTPESLEFYKKRENFIRDFLTNKEFIEKAFLIFTPHERQKFYSNILPSIEKSHLNELVESISTHKIKKRL